MVLELIGAITGSTVLSSVVTFILTKKKYNIEVESQQIHSVEEAFELYKKMTEETLDSQKRLMEATITFQNQTIDSQNKKLDDLQKENESLRRQVSELQLQLIKVFGDKFNPEAQSA